MKMVTGDNAAIAREISAKLGLGKSIQPATALFDDAGRAAPDAAERIEAADVSRRSFPSTSTPLSRPCRSAATWWR